jgi:hypothetical protein
MKKQYYNNININSNDLPIHNNEIITSNNLTLLVTECRKINSIFVNESGYDKRYNNTEKNNDVLIDFLINKEKKIILDKLESNTSCINNKLILVNNLYEFEKKSMYTSNIFNGGFWKDSNFSSL